MGQNRKIIKKKRLSFLIDKNYFRAYIFIQYFVLLLLMNIYP